MTYPQTAFEPPVNAVEHHVRAQMSHMQDLVTALSAEMDLLRVWGRPVGLTPQFLEAIESLVRLADSHPHLASGIGRDAPGVAPTETGDGGADGNGVDLVIEVLRSDATRVWTITEIYDALLSRGWGSQARDARNVAANLAAKAFRTSSGHVTKGTARGTYQWVDEPNVLEPFAERVTEQASPHGEEGSRVTVPHDDSGNPSVVEESTM